MTASVKVALEQSEQQMKIRITVQADGSNTVIESRGYTIEPGDARVIEETFDLPDNRTYTYTVSEVLATGDRLIEQKKLGE